MMTVFGLNLAAVFFLLCLVIAAIADFWRYIIPNFVSLLLAVGFPLVALTAPVSVDWIGHLGVGLGVLVIGLGLYAFGLMGAGDVKLLAAASLWMGLETELYFLIWVGLLGGALALALIILRKLVSFVPWIDPARLSATGPRRLLTDGDSIPYGLAISIAAVAVLPRIPVL